MWVQLLSLVFWPFTACAENGTWQHGGIGERNVSSPTITWQQEGLWNATALEQTTTVLVTDGTRGNMGVNASGAIGAGETTEGTVTVSGVVVEEGKTGRYTALVVPSLVGKNMTKSNQSDYLNDTASSATTVSSDSGNGSVTKATSRKFYPKSFVIPKRVTFGHVAHLTKHEWRYHRPSRQRERPVGYYIAPNAVGREHFNFRTEPEEELECWPNCKPDQKVRKRKHTKKKKVPTATLR